MRLFIAFDVSEETERYLRELQKQLPADSKLSLAKEFHLTLKFLGDVDETTLEKIKSALSCVKFSPFTAKTRMIGVFPDRRMIRVVWVGLEPDDKIVALQKEIESALISIFPKDEQFHPHLTLARVKFVKDKTAFIGALKSLKAKEIEFQVTSFRLMKSKLTPQGPVYEIVQEFS